MTKSRRGNEVSEMNYFEKNLEVLREHRPQVAEVMASEDVAVDKVDPDLAENGKPSVIFRRSNGEEVRIHSLEDPVKCAKNAVELLDGTAKEGLIVLLGFGLGYLAQELLNRFETGHMMLVYEATPQLFKAAMKIRDLTDVLTSPKIEILMGPDVDDFSFLERHHHHLVNGKVYLVTHLPSVRVNETAYDRFQRRFEEQKRLTIANVGTVVGLGKEFADAFMQNIPNVLRKPGVTALKDLFKGRAAIVVAAGPSLEKNLHMLKEAKSRAVIIAVDAALPTMLAAGILPDLLVAIDPLPENEAFFKDDPLLKHVPFVCLSQYTPEIVNVYPGPLFLNMAEQNVLALWLRQFWEDKGSIVCFGGSVAHLAFAAAEYLGCSSIALIGLDLSFGDKFHAGDASDLLVDIHGDGLPYELRNEACTAVDIFGEIRYTLSSFLSFKTSFENHVKTSAGLVINATEGGLPLEGVPNMRLRDFINEYCNAPELHAGSEIARRADTEVTYDLQGLIEEVTRARRKLQQIGKDARKLSQYIKKVQVLRKKREDPEEFYNILDNIERLTTKVRHPILNLIATYHYQLELYLKRQAVLEIDQIEDKLERLDAQLERGLIYYSQLLEALTPFLKRLEQLECDLRKEQKINRILTDTNIRMVERLYTAGTKARKAGRVTLAVKYFESLRSITVEKPDSDNNMLTDADPFSLPQLNFLLAQLYVRQYRHYDAREILQIIERESDQRVKTLTQTCHEKIRTWEVREARTKDLLKKGEESYGGSLESGLFYFRVGEYERAAKTYSNAVEEHSSGQPSLLVAALFGLAHSYLKLRENQKAVDAFAAALNADPANPLIYRDLALLAMENGNTNSGEIFLKKALEVAPWWDELYRLLANLYLRLGETEKATVLYEYGVQLNQQNPTLHRELAKLYQDLIFKRTQEDRMS
jgi:hypothetical protein